MTENSQDTQVQTYICSDFWQQTWQKSVLLDDIICLAKLLNIYLDPIQINEMCTSRCGMLRCG